jgi:hypothetical protein
MQYPVRARELTTWPENLLARKQAHSPLYTIEGQLIHVPASPPKVFVILHRTPARCETI